MAGDTASIEPLDLNRLLIGDAPWIFLGEVVLRAIVIYLLLLFFMRLMGKRVAAQLDFSELAIILTLGAAIGTPLQTPSTGLLAALIVLVVALAVVRGLAYVTMRSRRAEKLIETTVTILVAEGHMRPDALVSACLSRDKLFGQLRSEGFVQLGELRRVYLEATGQFCFIRFREPEPGLTLLPGPIDDNGELETVEGRSVCPNCGDSRDDASELTCRTCGDTERTAAVLRRR